MIARVISGKDIRGALNYNEQKVTEGVAECIMSNLFKDEVSNLTFYDKLNRFTDLNEKNKRTKTNTLHISLNFDVTEKLKVNELREIAATYMNRIGFGEQPFLVYEHRDAAHQHVHIVTTLIKKDGKRIPINFIGKNQSEKARKEMETEFNLVVAEKQSRSNDFILQPINIEKAVYGKSQTKKGIANVVTAVTRHYKYTSLTELNAILRQFNVIAERGRENSKMFEKKGLLYSIIDSKGNQIGIPIKASALPGKPMLSYLEKQFRLNEVLRLPHKETLKETLDTVLSKKQVVSPDQFKTELNRNKIDVVFRTNAEGRTYGVTLIDHKNKTVFNGSDLGKGYSANAIMEKLAGNAKIPQAFRPGFSEQIQTPIENGNSVWAALLHSDGSNGANPEAALRLGCKRRRKKGHRF